MRVLDFGIDQRGKKFDTRSTQPLRFAVAPTSADRESWWCASLTTAALQEIGILAGIEPNSLDVDDVIRLVSFSPRVQRLEEVAFL
jgi:hypothetical protein